MHPLIPYFEPFSFEIPGLGLSIHGFGILVAIAFLVGQSISQTMAEKFTGDKTAAERVNRLVGWLVVGTFVGGHMGDVLFYKPNEVLKDPMMLLRVWEGLSSFGGFSVCVPLCIWFFRKEKVDPWPYLDALAIGFSAGWFFGRMGCFSAHDHPGRISDFWLAVPGMCPAEIVKPLYTGELGDIKGFADFNRTIACHDLGLYEAFWSGGVYLLFRFFTRKPRFSGFYVAWIAMLYGPFRFALDFFRSASIDQDARHFGLTPAQIGSIVVTGLGIWMLSYRSRTAVKAAVA
jgi:phosphatidylglycerol:prolipoprotein diacylglycerol transferase